MPGQYDAGAARAKYELEATQALRAQQQLIKGYEALARVARVRPPPVPPSLPNPRQIPNQQRALDALRNSEIAAARAAQNHAQALRIIEGELGRASQGTVRYNQLLAQQSRAQAALARQSAGGLGPALPRTVESFGSQAIGQVKSELLGIVGPLALVTAGFTAATATADSFTKAFAFKADLDASRQSITTMLGATRNSGQVFSEASAFARRYAFTQREITDALAGSVQIMKVSNASTEQVLATLSRLGALNPEEGIRGASFALAELASGDVQSLVERFRISRTEAYAMRDAIASGADSVQVMAAFLDKSGVSMRVLENRTQGVIGKMNELKQAQEDLALAQAQFAQGPGLVILQGRINVTRDVTKALGGDFQALNAIINDSGIGALNPFLGLIGSYNDAVLGAGRSTLEWLGVLTPASAAADALASATLRAADADDRVAEASGNAAQAEQQLLDIEDRRVQQINTQRQASAIAIREQIDGMDASARSSIADAAAKDAQQAKTALLAEQNRLAVNSFLALNPGIDAAGVAALVAAGKVPELTGELAALRLETDSATGALNRLALQQNVAAGAAVRDFSSRVIGAPASAASSVVKGLGGGATAVFQQVDAEQRRIKDSEQALALARARTAKERIAILNAQLARTHDIAARNQILAQIEGERNSGAKGHTTELNKQLRLEEGIRDSKEAQLRASLDAAALTIRDRQERRKEDQELAKAQRILASGRASEAFKAAAADRAALIQIERQQRLLEISEKQKTAGGTIINGKVFQSVPGGDAAAAVPIGPVPVQTGPAVPTGAAAAAAGQVITMRLVDSADRLLFEIVEPFIAADMAVSLARSTSGGTR